MARLKRSDDTERRTAFVGSHVTPSDRAEITRRAELAGYRLSDFIRQTLLSRSAAAAVVPKLSPEIAQRLAYELAKIGTNLNQLTYHANATRSMPARDALDATLDEIVKATDVLTRL